MMNWRGDQMKTEIRTLNVELRTSNFEVNTNAASSLRRSKFDVQRSKFDVQRSTFAFALIFLSAKLALAQTAPHHPLPSLLQWEAAGARMDPIQSIDHHMGHIVDDLSDQKTDLPVQTKQKQVVGELDTLIKQMEAQMKSGSGGGNPNPTQPMQKSVLAKGPGGSGPLHDPRSGTKQWGDLSPKEREQITQSQTEGFPAGYEAVLSSYYNRLAQEKVSSETPVEGPTTKPVGP
jgi:hypothetical protein